MNNKNKIVFGKLDQMRNDQIQSDNKIRIGFVGGGPNSFIGFTHRLAARFDNRFICVAGVFQRILKNQNNLHFLLDLILLEHIQIILKWLNLKKIDQMELKLLVL